MQFTEPKKILVVDDEEIIRDACQEFLSMSGHEVETAAGGFEAMEKLNGKTFDLVVSDINMPGLDGIGLYLHILRVHPFLKGQFLFISGNQSQEEDNVVIERLGKKILKKPFTLEQLLNRINELIATPAAGLLKEEGVDRKRDKRFDWISGCQIVEDVAYTSDPLISWTNNISRGGLGIRHLGAPLAAGAAVWACFTEIDLRLKAQVVWSRTLSKREVVTGMKFDKPVDVSSITGGAIG